MSWVSKVTPLNLLEEKQKFLDDPTYNPQFIYETDIPHSDLTKFGTPKTKYLELAREILAEAYFGRNEADLLMTEGKKLEEDEVNDRFYTFLRMHHLEHRYQIQWSASFVSRASITEDVIKLRTNAIYRQEGVIGMIYHEIGTHGLRRVNYEQQPWYKKRKKNGLTTNYLSTEEGLATLHQLLPRTYRSAYTSAIRYLAVEYAQHHSLAEVWQWLGKYIQDPETRWMITSRQKRGLGDTSQPGGATKDLSYFEGMVETWQWLAKHNFDLTDVYLGKIAYKDAARARKLSGDFEPLLPTFFTFNRDEYAQNIAEIGQYNKLDQLG